VIVKDEKQLDAKRPVAPIDLSEKIAAPLLGIFGNDDKNPDVAQVNETEETLKRLGKNYEFHRYDGVGHAFFNTWRDGYRTAQALEGWEKVFAFYKKHLAA
jgi:carboxymethylenebutenolidase